jgi:WD40 repeat protein
MNLERALREAPVPGEGQARERARRTVLAAHAAAPRRTRPRAAGVIAAIVLAAAGAGALTRPGQAVGEWVQHQLEIAKPAKPKPAPAPKRQRGLDLPAPGRLLVASDRGLWIVTGDGARTRLGDWSSGSWSPHAKHIVVASGRTVAAIRPDGTLRWRREASRTVHDPRWSPNGYHVAYRAGSRMHVIWGNGIHDATLPGRAANAAPAWQPNQPRTLAWARADGTVIVQDAYTGLVIWRRQGGPVRRLSWSADGTRLLIAGARHGAEYAIGGAAAQRSARRLRLRPGETLAAAAFAPTGKRLALAVTSRGVTRITLRGGKAALAERAEPLRSLTWSPDGGWLVAGWNSGTAYLIGTRTTDVRSLDDVPKRLGGGVKTLGWCC